MRFGFFGEDSIVFCIMPLLKSLLPRRWRQLVPLELWCHLPNCMVWTKNVTTWSPDTM